ncbi:MAG: MBL fold metallo-hydrolase [Egibacteraceae bacterium]
MDNRTEQLVGGVWRVEVGYQVNAYVLANDGRGDREGLTVVDTGWRGSGPRLVRSVRMLGLDPRAIGDVLLTHCHADHAGSAARFAASSARSQVWVGAADLGTIRGTSPQPTAATRVAARLGGGLAPVPDARPLVGGDERDAGGVRVIATPGHTPGHCAFLLSGSGVLLVGDAVANILALVTPPRVLNADTTAVRGSIATLAGLDFDTLAMGHGPPLTKRARERLAKRAG